MGESAIEWTDAVWNPVTGCDRVSPGCAHCYALAFAPRLRAMAQARGHGRWLDVRDGGKASGPAFGVTLHPDVLDEPLRWHKPRRVFVNSMSDLFHEEVPDEYIARVFGVMAAARQHTFQILTKRPERMADLLTHPQFENVMRRASGELGHELPLPNVWLGVTIENRRFVHRADLLRATPAAVRFISAEPLLGPLLPDANHYVDAEHETYPLGDFPVYAWRPWADESSARPLDLTGIDWLIVGGESGPNHRPIRPEWVRDLKEVCQTDGWEFDGRDGHTAFFFKQWGGHAAAASCARGELVPGAAVKLAAAGLRGASEERLVMANRANNVPRVAAEESAPPVLTGETVGVVHARGVVEVQRHGDVRLADASPVHTVRAGGQHHGVIVIRQNTARGDAGQMATPGDTQPVRALTTAGHQSVLLPYYRTGEASPAAEQPTGTLSTRDRLALVVPHATGNDPALAASEPTSTMTTRGKHAVVWADEDIDECRFRMFALHEIAGAMVMHNGVDGGPYEVLGNKRERMAQYGNSVTPPAMAWLISRLADAGVDISRIVDLFCGAGGSSIGAELAGGRLVLGLNHWKRAVETHATNFQHADHDCEDISSLTTRQIKRYLAHARPTVMIAGPECTNHSIAKGAARRKPQKASLFDDGPGHPDEQDKSRATMWDVARFAEQAILAGQPLEAIVVENVVDAFKWGAGDDGGLFNAWLTAIDALGYSHEIVWLNSMFAPPAPDPAPQSRDRMYVVFWLKGRKAPELRVEPPAWCPSCERLVAGQQTWKRPDRRPWGRYGAQYLYGCPDCRSIVLPGAFPAASIIDPSLPAPRIGERAKPLATNTRERIRRGLERLSNEPFAIRLTHGGVPKPLTLPLVTLTQRHDMAVVMANTENAVPRPAERSPTPTLRTEGGLAMVTPVAGNTFERTPGNRARDADRQPADTVHGTLDRALVVPPMGGVDPRPAETVPAPTQTTTTRAALVTSEEPAA